MKCVNYVFCLRCCVDFRLTYVAACLADRSNGGHRSVGGSRLDRRLLCSFADGVIVYPSSTSISETSAVASVRFTIGIGRYVRDGSTRTDGGNWEGRRESSLTSLVVSSVSSSVCLSSDLVVRCHRFDCSIIDLNEDSMRIGELNRKSSPFALEIATLTLSAGVRARHVSGWI